MRVAVVPHPCQHLILSIFLFIYFWLCWVFVSVRGLSLVAASGGPSSSRCAGLSLSRPLLLRNTGSRRSGSVVVAHGPSCSTACGIFPDQGSNLCPLHWQADSQPLSHQGIPVHLSNVSHSSGYLSNFSLWIYLHFSDHQCCRAVFHVLLAIHVASVSVQHFANFLLGYLLSSKCSGHRPFVGDTFCKRFFPSLWLCSAF